MQKYVKYILSAIAVLGIVISVACDQIGGQKKQTTSKTLTNTKGKGFVRCGVLCAFQKPPSALRIQRACQKS